MRPLSIYLLEEQSLAATRLSCLTSRLKAGGRLHPNLAWHEVFSDESSFRNGLHAVAEAMFNDHLGQPAEGRRHLFILSAHGIAQTGTSLQLPDEKKIDLRFYDRYFSVWPEQATVWVSACWGGYPGPIAALTARATHHRPTFVGPLVPIEGPHNVELQNTVVDAMLNEVDFESSLVEAARRLNAKWETNYGHEAVRVVTRKGEWIPEQGAGGFAEEVRERADYRIVAVQHGVNSSGDPTNAILTDGGAHWQVSVDEVFAVGENDDVWSLPGTILNAKFKVMHEQCESGVIGKLAESVGSVRRVQSAPPGLPIEQPPVAHSGDRCDGTGERRPLDSQVLKDFCTRCNWCALAWKRQVTPTSDTEVEATISVEGYCLREECAIRELPEVPR
jgi:hypothetical protein